MEQNKAGHLEDAELCFKHKMTQIILKSDNFLSAPVATVPKSEIEVLIVG